MLPFFQSSEKISVVKDISNKYFKGFTTASYERKHYLIHEHCFYSGFRLKEVYCLPFFNIVYSLLYVIRNVTPFKVV